MKVTIEIEVPDSIDLNHAYESVTDALNLSDNVTQKEHDLIKNFITNITRELLNTY